MFHLKTASSSLLRQNLDKRIMILLLLRRRRRLGSIWSQISSISMKFPGISASADVLQRISEPPN